MITNLDNPFKTWEKEPRVHVLTTFLRFEY